MRRWIASIKNTYFSVPVFSSIFRFERNLGRDMIPFRVSVRGSHPCSSPCQSWTKDCTRWGFYKNSLYLVDPWLETDLDSFGGWEMEWRDNKNNNCNDDHDHRQCNVIGRQGKWCSWFETEERRIANPWKVTLCKHVQLNDLWTRWRFMELNRQLLIQWSGVKGGFYFATLYRVSTSGRSSLHWELNLPIHLHLIIIG